MAQNPPTSHPLPSAQSSETSPPGPDIELTNSATQLQLFKDAHSSCRATAEQLEAIFLLEEGDREAVIDWLENPRALYPLAEGENLLERAIGVVVSERQANQWTIAGAKEGDLEKGEKDMRKRRGAVVAAHFDGLSERQANQWTVAGAKEGDLEKGDEENVRARRDAVVAAHFDGLAGEGKGSGSGVLDLALGLKNIEDGVEGTKLQAILDGILIKRVD